MSLQPRSRSGLALGVVCAALTAVSAAPLSPASAATKTEKPANERLAAVVAGYSAQHPGDYVGLDRAIRAHGGDSVRFAVAGHGSASARTAQRLGARAQSRSRTKDCDLPCDAFGVGGAWYHVQDQFGEWWNATGTWNFRDDYIGAGDPGDASGIRAQVPSCWVNDGEFIYAKDYQGNTFPDGGLIRQDADLSSSIYEIDDQTSGFKMLTDNGSHTLSFRRNKSGCDGEPLQARYKYEHNQDGGGSWSLGFSFLGFSLNYTDIPPRLEKATEVFRT